MKNFKKLLGVLTITGLILTACSMEKNQKTKPITEDKAESQKEETTIKQVDDLDQALEIALKDQGLNQDQVQIIKSEYDPEDKKYDIEFIHDNKEYEYEILASGTIKNIDIDSLDGDPIVNPDNRISPDQAKEIALADAGLTDKDIRDFSLEEDFENGISFYELEFEAGSKEYSYEIDLTSGEILKKEVD